MGLILLLVDGLGDVAVPELDNLTATEHLSRSGQLPNFTFLAKNSDCGVMDPVSPGLTCGSDTAHLNLLGYDPFRWYTGRGTYEALGSGVDLEPGDLAFKCNFAVCDQSGVVVRRKIDNFASEAADLCCLLEKSCNQDLLADTEHSVAISHQKGHRCIVRLRDKSKQLSDLIETSDPLKDGMPLLRCKAKSPDNPMEAKTAELVNRISDHIRERLKGLSKRASCILFRGAGMLREIPPFSEFSGISCHLLTDTCVIAGVAKSLSIPCTKFAIDGRDYREMFARSLQLVDDVDFCFVHVKPVDDACHNRLLTERLDSLKDLDVAIGIFIESAKEKKISLVVTGDHTSVVATGDHSCEPVPFLVYPRRSNVEWSPEHFSDLEFGLGYYGRFRGCYLLPIIKSVICREEKKKFYDHSEKIIQQKKNCKDECSRYLPRTA